MQTAAAPSLKSAHLHAKRSYLQKVYHHFHLMGIRLFIIFHVSISRIFCCTRILLCCNITSFFLKIKNQKRFHQAINALEKRRLSNHQQPDKRHLLYHQEQNAKTPQNAFHYKKRTPKQNAFPVLLSCLYASSPSSAKNSSMDFPPRSPSSRFLTETIWFSISFSPTISI